MITRGRAVVTGLVALAALTLVVLGLPVMLYRFGGSPVPGQLAGWHRVTTVLSSRDDGTLLLAIIRECSWLAWVLFTACVLAEAQAAIRGRNAPYLRLGGLQGSAAHLITLAALAFATPSAMTLSASVTATGQPAAGHLGVSPALGEGPQHGIAPDTLDARAAATSRLVVIHPGDCLWSLAERYLGAGDRYPEIVHLNYGHHVGGGQVFSNPSLIEPGWQLLLPASAAVGPGHGHHQLSAADRHLGHPSADPHYRRRHAAAGKGTATGSGSPRARTSGATSAVGGAADQATYPAGDQAAQGAEQSGAQQSGAQQAGGHTVGAQRRGAHAGAQLPETTVFVTGALAGAVLTSLSRLRLRQRQQRRRGRRIALPADPRMEVTEQRLRAAALAADPDMLAGQQPLHPAPSAESAAPLDTLWDALGCLEAGILSAGQELPDIVGIHVTPDVLEVLLATPATDGPPAPYIISPGRQGMCWQLDMPAIVSVPGGRAGSGGGATGGGATAGGLACVPCHLMPGLITAGATAAGYLLLDLESLLVTSCDGPAALVDQVVTTTATELATGQWSGWYELILVGCEGLEPLGRAEHCATLDSALDLLESRCAAIAHRLTTRGPADVRELRLAEPDNEDWGLTILVSRDEPSAEQMTRLLRLAEDGPGGVAALVAGDPEAADGRMAPTAFQLAPDPDVPEGIVANVVPLQITVRPRALSDGDYDAIGGLFSTAAQLDDMGRDESPYLAYAAPPWIPQSASQPDFGAGRVRWAADDGAGGLSPDVGRAQPDLESHAESDLGHLAAASFAEVSAEPEVGRPATAFGPAGATAGLEIRILGPFTITGSAEPLQPKQAELVLALALAAPAGLSNSALCSMLGPDPDHPKPGDAIRQIITRTRRRLGLAGDGQEHITHAGNGRYLLHPDATLDWSRFRELVGSGRADDLRAAVALISGQPFTGSYFWWIDIPLAETVRAELVDAAETLAELELATGSARAAARAARAGLMAEASAEQLWRAVMRAEHAAGNMAGVTEAWHHCLTAIEDVAPGGEPHPDTAALYRQLTAGLRQHMPVRR